MSTQDRYKIFKRINAGGMAEIYLGAVVGGEGVQKICAIKKVLDDLEDDDYVRMFRDEIKTSSLLHHSNIVQTFGSDVVEGSTCLVMEYVQGVDLEYLMYHCKKTQVFLSVPMSIYIVSEAAQGLHYAHGLKDPVSDEPLNLIHRDISPGNLIISYEGEVKISDFGIAKSTLSSSKTKAGVIKGKFSYMAPEYVAGERIDQRADIYSLGVVLWEMLAGKKLHVAGDTKSKNLLDMFIERKNRRKLTLLNSDVDQGLEDIVEKCLEKDPKERYPSMSDLHRDLTHYLNLRDPKFNRGKVGSFLKTMLAKDYSRTRKLLKEAHIALREMAEDEIHTDIALPAAAGDGFSQGAEPPPLPQRPMPRAVPSAPRSASGSVAQAAEAFVPGLIGADHYVARGKELELGERDARNIVSLAQAQNRPRTPQPEMARVGIYGSRPPVTLRSRPAQRLSTRYHKEPSSLGVNLLLIVLIFLLIGAAIFLYRSKTGRFPIDSGSIPDVIYEKL